MCSHLEVRGQLRSVIEPFRTESLPEQPDARIEEDFVELSRAIELLETERLRRLAEIDRRGIAARDGYLSTSSWLAVTERLPHGEARAKVRLARALEEMPQARRSLDDGEVSLSAVEVLARARKVDPDAFFAAEGLLVEAARRHTIRDLARVCAFWRDRVERDRFPDARERAQARRKLHASPTLDGMVRIDGDLDPVAGESVLVALRAVLDSEARDGAHDERTPAQRRADALGEICRAWLDLGERPEVAGERPHLTVTIDIDGLSDHRAGQLGHAGPVGPEAVRELVCDASLTRVVMRGSSEVLDVGRRTPVVSPAIRRAVVIRDRGCVFPGCDRPHTWCDAHHVRHWADGGATAVSNLVLLCRRHHRAVHDGFGLRMEGERPVFSRPDGSLLEDRAPPWEAAV
jgi:hypothetical protein